MRIQNVRLLLLLPALSLQLSILRAENVQGEEFSAANTHAPAGDTLSAAEIKTMLRDFIDTDKLARPRAGGLCGRAIVCLSFPLHAAPRPWN